MDTKNKKNGNVPNLRFKEFEGEWEIKKLGEVSNVSKLAGYEFTKYVVYQDTGKIIALRGLNVKNNSLDLSDVKYIDESDLSKLNRSKLFINDLMFTYIGTIGEVALIDENDRFYLAPNVSRIRIDKDKVVPHFLLQYFNNPRFRNTEIAKYISSSSQPALTMKNVRKFGIILPSLPEQTKIASFLSLIDERIATQMKTIQSLESLMRGLREKIFSQKLRFRDGKGNEFAEWEDKTLGEIGNFQTSSIDKLIRDNEKIVFLINYMNVYRHENINSKTVKLFQIVSAKDSQIENCNLKKGDILFTPSSETADDIGHSVVISENLENTVFSYHLMRFRPNIKLDILYSHYFCNIPTVLNQLSKLATGSTRFTISVKSFSSVKIKLPTLSEQTKIANFLSSIDRKIETEKEILTQYQSQKKYLLQNLFI